MRILFVNDDGIEAKGLQSLVRVFEKKYDCRVVAPRFEQSAKSHSFTMREPVKLSELHEKKWTVSGTPADCVYVALHHLDCRPDVIISGINQGTNLGTDVFYSGTVGAAREGALNSIRSFAVSTEPLENTLSFYEGIAETFFAIFDQLLLLPGMLHNINLSTTRGAAACMAPLGRRLYQYRVRVEESGLILGGPPCGYEGEEDCDIACYERGLTTITPLSMDGTDYQSLEVIRQKNTVFPDMKNR